jgi:A/G-specific adenine glycosylase
MPDSPLHRPVLDWYRTHARSLPWRRPDVSGWEVLVSEVMLQQTPVVRVLPVYDAWVRRWPVPAALAAEPAGEAIRMWGRLGYPRRALRLHAAAVEIDLCHEGVVPRTREALRALPGVGEYTAAAVCAFAFRQRAVVLDTNVRRVQARVLDGRQFPPAQTTAGERRRCEAVLPDDPETAATWSVAAMELGALVCTAATPRCLACPVQDQCLWRRAGHPAYDGPPRRAQTYARTDRQCRGRILALLRDSNDAVDVSALDSVWDEPAQLRRSLASLLDDGLVVQRDGDRLALP